MDYKNNNLKITGSIEAGSYIGLPTLASYYDNILIGVNITRRYYPLLIAGGNGIAQVYLTSDGLIKSESNTFTYGTVIYGSGIGLTIPTVDDRAIFAGFDYNVTTGLARFSFVESKTTGVLLGGSVEGLEAKENGYSVICFVDGY